MRLAYFDCSYGVAGDMILGALVDAGAPFAALKRELEEGLGLEGIRLSRRKVARAGVAATRVRVRTEAAHDRHRRLGEIEGILRKTAFPSAVKKRARDAYRRLAQAEAKVHNTSPEKIHFHEVGCLDAIADVAGAMLALDMLGVERVEVSPLALGSGSARCAHGILPVPAPATVELLRGAPTVGGAHAMEMTTPTGAAILTTVASGFGPQPLMSVERVGYGAGKRSIEGHANLLRVLIGEASEEVCAGRGALGKEGASRVPERARPRDTARLPGSLQVARLALMVTEVDDMSPELLGDLMTRLFEAGCLDAHFTPIQMKKNRPATQIQVLCDLGAREAFIELLLRHTTTFGLKVLEVERICLPRRKETIETDLGPIEIKIGFWGDDVLKITPEYESCRRLARSAGLSLQEIYLHAQTVIRRRMDRERGAQVVRPAAKKRAKSS
jgi:hypothetical protein